MTEIFMTLKDDDKEKQSSIVVPIDDDMDKVSHSPNTVDELAMELATNNRLKKLPLSEVVIFLSHINK